MNGNYIFDCRCKEDTATIPDVKYACIAYLRNTSQLT